MIIAGQTIPRKSRQRVVLDVDWLFDFSHMRIPVEVLRGEQDGPVCFITSTIHGDEINGIEILRRLLKKLAIEAVSGTLIIAPVINVFGFSAKSRYLPDRRDFNRCFPGAEKGSLGAQLAHMVMEHVVRPADFGIDLHTAATGRSNWPQLRVDMDDAASARLAHAFGAPAILSGAGPEGALRRAALEEGIPVIVYEGGHPLSFEEDVVQQGLDGILRVLVAQKMIPPHLAPHSPPRRSYLAPASHWLRAPEGGLFLPIRKMGDLVRSAEILGWIRDPLGDAETPLCARADGMIIGQTTTPLVNRGDALMHIACAETTPLEDEPGLFDAALIGV